MSIRIRIYHNDFPEELEKQLREHFGDDMDIEKSSSGELVVAVDDRGTGWRRPWIVENFLDDLRENNEFVHKTDVIG